MSDLPIADHALLSDRHSAALVTRDGSIAWLCFPRFDSESVFASILDDAAGHWSIRPSTLATSTRSYVEGTMALQTTFHTDEGTLELIDALELGDSSDPHRLGENAPHTLLRGVHCTRGRVTIEMTCRPRPEYGLVVPVFAEIDSGVVATGGSGRLTLSLPAPVTGLGGEIRVRFTLEAGQHRYFALQRTRLGEPLPGAYTQDEIATGLASTTASWQEWSAIHQSYDGPWRELVHHSGRVLQALSYQPTGAIVAAATTSLPEEIGGERNWDYRYSWVRDASFTMKALWVAACPDEAHEFFDFMTAAAAHSSPDRHLQIMFGIGGEHDLSERFLPQLTGWRGSGPVRVGNGAWDQPQLDVYGELLDAAFRLSEQLGEIEPATRTFLVALADAAASQWQQPDNGIWEIRGAPRHFLYSKLMCWVALDRAIAMAEQLHATDRVAEWSTMAAQIRATILEKGWNEEAGAFTQSFDSPDLDAAALMLPIVGFLPASDPRVLATVDAIIERLTDTRGLVYRYQTDTGVDGLNGNEGTFLLCTFWLAHVLAAGGRSGEAREVFERAVSHTNDVGLLAEEIDSETGEQLGNFPQAFSHVGLINAAWAIDQAESHFPANEGTPAENAP
ncbi:glycoside hydrolase family 15 protein [Cryobacterium psychrophilum]|uniref:Glycoside hydrolase family 15 protein n=1 Tax=Cryobacterium psychrophilum TaxID=41988 RepID=A0A4Y8KRQ8_9MICO|nr:glycoside hydrolase family 15 protein [Cryobacterium psychrophilum]TDW28647.1 GH15 family glucan-1,4-alpha-glucosidase [Cryobacterium psychrophilum]TFD82310.1 glycoside hydrolase family 15 protein [Cryobacterium psychrophilum]